MDINRNNYEMYFLDYHEGRLEPWQVAELLLFLESHPEFQEEFEDFENIPVTPDMSVSFSGKNSLKKNNVLASGPIDASNYETYFIASAENQLTHEEQQWLAGFLDLNPGLVSGYELYLKTIFHPDLNIQYPKKTGLKRSILNTSRFYYYMLSTAASIALLVAVFMNSGTKQENLLAARHKPTKIHALNTKKAHPVMPKLPVSASKMIAYTKAYNIPGIRRLISNQPHAYPQLISAGRKPVIEIQTILASNITSRNFVEPEYIFIRQNKNNQEIYANLYDQVNLAERMQNEQLLTPVVSSPKSILSSSLHKLGSIFTGRETPSNHSTINFWTLADLGINGYNLLTDRDLKLLTQSNDSGKVVSYALKGDEFEFIRQQNKSKKP